MKGGIKGMNKKLLTFDDLYNYYSKYKKTMKFDSKKTGDVIVVQTEGKLTFESKDNTSGLTAVKLQACHTERNLNSSSISKEVMEEKMLPTFKNRPILGYIHMLDLDNGNGEQPYFWGHNMHLEDEEIVYDEKPIGIIPETNNAKLEYDEEENRYNVLIDGYIFNEYSQAKEILEREKECSCSVEIAIESMSYSPKDKCLIIEDGYFAGVTILGRDEKGNIVKPGMAGSNVKLKDFSEENNSLLSSLNMEENSKLIDTLEKLNKSIENLSKFNNINDENQDNVGKEETNVEKGEIKFEDEVVGTQGGEVTETESTEASEDKKKEKCTEDEELDVDGTDEEPKDEDKTEVKEEESKDDVEEDDEVKEEEKCGDKKKYSKTFELSFDDIRCGLYELLRPYEEADNEWYYVNEVFETYFIYSGMSGKIYGQKYTKEGETVAFDGERYELFLEYLTESEKTELETMRSNYSAIEKELNSYKEAEEIFEKKTIFEDDAYSAYLDTKEFKTLMSEDTLKKFTKEELSEKADAALGKLVKTNKTFSLEEKVETKSAIFGFAKVDHKSNFFDGLLGK